MSVPEAPIEDKGHGKIAADAGWWILNVKDMVWDTVEGGGSWCGFESPNAISDRLGIGIHVLPPGEAPGFYHWESEQEGFLILAGECVAIVEGQERRMKQWDYLHCPPGTEHITVGAEGDEPCAILMVGTRSKDKEICYPVEPAAAKYGWSVEAETRSPREAYKNRPPIGIAPGPAFPRS